MLDKSIKATSKKIKCTGRSTAPLLIRDQSSRSKQETTLACKSKQPITRVTFECNSAGPLEKCCPQRTNVFTATYKMWIHFQNFFSTWTQCILINWICPRFGHRYISGRIGAFISMTQREGGITLHLSQKAWTNISGERCFFLWRAL